MHNVLDSKLLEYPHSSVLPEIREGCTVDYLTGVDEECCYLLSLFGLPDALSSMPPATEAECAEQLPGLELVCDIMRLAMEHWRRGIPSRLVLPASASATSFPALRIPGLTVHENPVLLTGAL